MQLWMFVRKLLRAKCIKKSLRVSLKVGLLYLVAVKAYLQPVDNRTHPWYAHMRYNKIYFSKGCQRKVAATPHQMNYFIEKVSKFPSKAWESLQRCLILFDRLTNQLSWLKFGFEKQNKNSKGRYIKLHSSGSSTESIFFINSRIILRKKIKLTSTHSKSITGVGKLSHRWLQVK